MEENEPLIEPIRHTPGKRDGEKGEKERRQGASTRGTQSIFDKLTSTPHAQYLAAITMLLAIMMVLFALERERIVDLEADDWEDADSPYDLKCNEWDDVRRERGTRAV